jgi:hypothetical protein
MIVHLTLLPWAVVFEIIDTMLTKKKFKDLLQKNVVA